MHHQVRQWRRWRARARLPKWACNRWLSEFFGAPPTNTLFQPMAPSPVNNLNPMAQSPFGAPPPMMSQPFGYFFLNSTNFFLILCQKFLGKLFLSKSLSSYLEWAMMVAKSQTTSFMMTKKLFQNPRRQVYTPASPHTLLLTFQYCHSLFYIVQKQQKRIVMFFLISNIHKHSHYHRISTERIFSGFVILQFEKIRKFRNQKKIKKKPKSKQHISTTITKKKRWMNEPVMQLASFLPCFLFSQKKTKTLQPKNAYQQKRWIIIILNPPIATINGCANFKNLNKQF